MLYQIVIRVKSNYGLCQVNGYCREEGRSVELPMTNRRSSGAGSPLAAQCVVGPRRSDSRCRRPDSLWPACELGAAFATRSLMIRLLSVGRKRRLQVAIPASRRRSGEGWGSSAPSVG
jgi:hypothetical protein